MATDGFFIYFAEEWVGTLSDDELVGVFAHEVLHCVLGHPDRRRNREPRAWNMATDLAINWLLVEQGFVLPKGGLIDRRFAALSAEEIYRELMREADQPGTGRSPAMRTTSRGQRANTASRRTKAYKGFDQHLDPDSHLGSDLHTEPSPDAEERRLLRREFIAELEDQLPGTVSGRLSDELRLAVQRPLDWQAILRRWLFDRVKSDWRSVPFAKRYIHRGIYLPSVGVDAPGHLVFAIDTSGSMSSEDVGHAFAEVQALRSVFPCRLTLLQCDAQIKDVREFEAGDSAHLPEDMEILGRGGTGFVPVFDYMAAHLFDSNPVLVFVTDGYGSFPKAPPSFPVVWIATRHAIGDSKFPFGNVIRLSSE